MSRGTPRRHGSGLIGVVICLGCPLHSLLVRSRPMWPPLVHEIEWFSGSISPLICSFDSGKGRALIHRVVLFIEYTHFYRVQWEFVPKVLSHAPRIEDGQSSLGFLLFPFDMQGIHVHGKSLPHLALEIFKFVSKG